MVIKPTTTKPNNRITYLNNYKPTIHIINRPQKKTKIASQPKPS